MVDFTGTNGADSIDGGAGHDSLLGGVRWDTLTGASGNDTINGWDADTGHLYWFRDYSPEEAPFLVAVLEGGATVTKEDIFFVG